MDIIWQKMKILTFPFNSYYSFINPEKKLKDYNDGVLFDEIGEGNDKLDKIKLLKNSIFDSEENTEEWILSQIKILSEYFFTIRSNKLYIDEDEKYEDSRLFNMYVAEGKTIKKYLWYYLKRMTNKDIFKACFVQNNFDMNNAEIEIINSSIFTTDPLLESILQKGISETHMHAGAGRNFLFLWIDIMNSRTSENIEIMTFEGKINLKNHLLLAQFTRIMMSLFLNDTIKLKSFQKYIEEYKSVINCFYNGKVTTDDERGVEILEMIEKSKRKNKIDILNIASDDTLKQFTLKSDIITRIFNDFYFFDKDNNCHSAYGDENTIIFPENVLLLKIIKYLNDNEDEYFRRIFIQYIRIKNIFEQYIMQQDNDGKGLDIFKKIYKRQSNLNKRNSFAEVFYTHFESQHIKKMEIRITPEKEGEIEKTVKTILNEYEKLLSNKNYSDYSFPLVGLIFHFIKEKSNREDKCYNLYESLNKEKYLHFGDVKAKNKELSVAILNLINRIPEIGNYIVGIDAASGENDTEPYVFKEIYEMFRKTENMHDKKYRHNKLSNTLGFTYHVGEDFRDIISGLRHIDEVVEHYKFIPGDRIGHGIVIGIDVNKWKELNKIIFLPINEYLENLLWEWGLYNNNEELKNNDNLSYLENCIYKTAEKIFGFLEGITVRDLYDLYISKFNNNIEYLLDDCILQQTKKKYEIEKSCEYKCFETSNWNRSKLRKAMNCKYFINSMEKNVSLEINNRRIEKYIKLQEFMKNKLSKKGIIIEVNPTSNILIGEFESYRDFHIENLSSPKEEKIIVTINTDDPITFNTKLSNEYSLLMDLMIKNGEYTRKEIMDWIDKLRENGNNFSFIKDRGVSKEYIIKEVKKIIEKL